MTNPKNNLPKFKGYTFSKDIIDLMKSKLEKTKDIGKEFGFSLCSKPKENVLHGRGHMYGKEDRIIIDRKCYEDEKHVGTYHTHMDETSKLSLSDIDIMRHYKDDISCIGGDIDKKIVCYAFRDEKRKVHIPEKWLKAEDIGEIDDQDYDKYIKSLDNIEYKYMTHKNITKIR